MLRKLWNDETGAVLSAEIILVLTILICGLVIGWTAVRDAITTELADVGQAIGSLNQSYSFSGVSATMRRAWGRGSRTRSIPATTCVRNRNRRIRDAC